MNIMDFFPKDKTPRGPQKETLEAIESLWNSSDVFLVDAPVALGKSAIAITIAKWAAAKGLTSSILTKDRMLVNQYAADYPSLAVLRAARDYVCKTYGNAQRAKAKMRKHWKVHRDMDKCEGCQRLYLDTTKARTSVKSPIPLLCNMHTHLAHRLYKKVLIIDEAHNLVPFLQELHTKHFWRKDINFPPKSWSRNDLKKWAEKDPSAVPAPLLEELRRDVPRFSLVRDFATYFGNWEERLSMVPFDVRGEAPFMWPGKGTKLVFLSATINQKDLERIGLEDRRWSHIDTGSVIGPERRPIYIDAVDSMAFRNQSRNMPELVSYVRAVWTHYGKTRGLVHVPYNLAEKLKQLGKGLPLFFHDKKNKQSQFSSWLRSDQGILIASGMTEGLDLAGEKARWQVIGKVPWPSLADPVIKEWSERDPDSYVWETLKQIIQAGGRVCRGPEDFGATHIFDNDIIRLLEMAESARMIPLWWKESLRKGDEEWMMMP